MPRSKAFMVRVDLVNSAPLQRTTEVKQMTQSRRDRLDDDLARKWLAKHAPKQASTQKPRLRHPEQWEIRREQQKRERRSLAHPLLKAVE
jgi:hypothetical protein